MGARHSKRSVDITTTPKKGEDGAAVIEGEEGKLEKIAESDLKVTTNGTLHNEIEFADKEETSKDETEEREKVEFKPEIIENGLPEEPSNESKKAEMHVENSSAQVNGETEKTPEKETADQKIEETTEQKKKKEKKKKWSFRSISFSKKDKSKPSKESTEKNGEVKEVAEENLEDKNASPTVAQSTKPEETTPTQNAEPAAPVVNGDSTHSEESTKATEAEPTPKAVQESPKSTEEPAKSSEPKVEPKIEDEKSEEPKKVEAFDSVHENAAEPTPTPGVVEEAPKMDDPSKEVRTEEVPPPLPSSNPPSSVTVFAESTKAETALTSGQVPLEEPKEVQEIAELSVAEPITAELPMTEDSALPEPPVVSNQASVTETTAEPLPPNHPEPIDEVVPKHPDEPLLPNPPSLVSELCNVEVLPATPHGSDKSSEGSLPTPFEAQGSNPDPSPSLEDLPPAPPSPISDQPFNSEPVIEPDVAKSEPVVDCFPVSVESLAETTPCPSTVTEEVQKTESISEAEPPAEPISVPEIPKSQETTVTSPQVEPLTPPPTPAASVEIPPLELLSNVEVLPAHSPPPTSDVSEPVAPADSLPDISTESLPSLPEPVSESLAPMSLPPVDSVPEPIASSEHESLLQKEVPHAPLTNGNMNGHSSPSPTEDAVVEPAVPGPTKQITSEMVKESDISPEAGDNPSETAVARAEE